MVCGCTAFWSIRTGFVCLIFLCLIQVTINLIAHGHAAHAEPISLFYASLEVYSSMNIPCTHGFHELCDWRRKL
jgi:hypothetical protein